MQEVCRLFTYDSDEKALELLYEITKDKLCKIALDWILEYGEIITSSYETNEWYMYDDIINYLWKKYNIGGDE